MSDGPLGSNGHHGPACNENYVSSSNLAFDSAQKVEEASPTGWTPLTTDQHEAIQVSGIQTTNLVCGKVDAVQYALIRNASVGIMIWGDAPTVDQALAVPRAILATARLAS